METFNNTISNKTSNTSTTSIFNNNHFNMHTIDDMFHSCFSIEIFEEYLNKYWTHITQPEKHFYINLKKAMIYDDFRYIESYDVNKYIELKWYCDFYIVECKEHKCWELISGIVEKSIRTGVSFNMYSFITLFLFGELAEYLTYLIIHDRADLLSTMLTIIYNYLKLQNNLSNFYKLMEVIDIIWNSDIELHLYKIYIIEQKNVVIVSPNLIINGNDYNNLSCNVIYI